VPATGLVLLALRLLTTEPTGWSLQAVCEASGLAATTTLAYILWDVAMRKGNLLLVVACSSFTPLLSTLVSLRIPESVPQSQALGRLPAACVRFLVTWRSVSE